MDVIGEMKKSVLVVYPDLGIGGSSSSLIGFLSAIDKTKYDVDLQLYKCSGPLYNKIPSDVHVLTQSFLGQDESIVTSIRKWVRFLLSGYWGKVILYKIKFGFKKSTEQIMADFRVEYLSKPNKKEYDFAIGFLEGWSDRYLAYHVTAKKKIGWFHGTFANVAPIPCLECDWIAKVDNVVFVTEECKRDFDSQMPMFAKKTVVVKNIIDSAIIKEKAGEVCNNDVELQRFYENNAFKIVTVCRIDIETKGIDRIIAAAKALKKDGENFIWCIVGGGPQLDELRKIVKANSLSDYFILPGFRMNPYVFISMSDIFCLASRYEGEPISVYESLILGVPTLVTEYLSAQSQVKDGQDGWIVKNTDDDSLYREIKYLLNNRNEVAQCKYAIGLKDFDNRSYMRYIESTLFE